MKSLQEIVDILSKSGYLNCKILERKIIDVEFLLLGSIFLNRIKSEWQKSKGTINTYLIPSNNYTNYKNIGCNFINNYSYIKSSKFNQNFLYIKNNFQKEVPLAIKEELNFSAIPFNKLGNNDNRSDIRLDINNGTLLTSTYFISEQSAIKYFYKIQRERKIWWMKLSSNPGRYFLTDLKSNEITSHYKSHSIKIKSKFCYGDLELENIYLVPLKALKLENQNDFYLKDSQLNRRSIPTVVRSELQLEAATVSFLLDSVENTKNCKMSINKKIAPYQCCLFCISEDEKIIAQLSELATHLTNAIRKSGISVLNLPKCFTSNKIALKKEIIQMDKIGVPYSLILESTCLQDGLMKLRYRETTLSETIHITDIPNYLLEIFHSE